MVYVNDKNLFIAKMFGQSDIRCYSYDKMIASYDLKYGEMLTTNEDLSTQNKKHLEIFKQILVDNGYKL